MNLTGSPAVTLLRSLAFAWLVLAMKVDLALAAPPVTEKPLDARTTAQRIDRFIETQIDKEKISPSPRSDDAEFQRRLYLDLTGQLPPLERVSDFLDSKNPDKRAKLIDHLLASPEHGKHLARYWAELFIKRDGEQNKRLKSDTFRAWLAEQFHQGHGWDRILGAMLTLEGEGAASMFFQANRLNGDRPSPAKVVGTTASLFLGVQLQCAECHDHPTQSWKRKEFWELAGFFGRTRFEKGTAKNSTKITEEEPPPPDPKAKGRPTFRPPASGKIDIPDALDAKVIADTVTARFPGQPAPKLNEHGPHRPLYAAWMTDPKNPWFTRAAVNRYWSLLFARGLVNPLDDMNPDNLATHPELLDFLAADFVRSGHDLRHLLRSICNSETYQRTTSATKENRDHDSYARMPVKFLQGEVLLNCLDQVLGAEVIVTMKKGKNEIDVKIPNVELFDTSGYDESLANYSFGAPQLLRLLNSELPRRSPALIARLQGKTSEAAPMIEQLFLLTLSRRPSAEETKEMLALVKSSGESAKGYAAVLWVLIGSAEFVANH